MATFKEISSSFLSEKTKVNFSERNAKAKILFYGLRRVTYDKHSNPVYTRDGLTFNTKAADFFLDNANLFPTSFFPIDNRLYFTSSALVRNEEYLITNFSSDKIMICKLTKRDFGKVILLDTVEFRNLIDFLTGTKTISQ